MKLALGTAQFGLDYGVSNTQGQVCPSEVNKILTLAKHEGINTLDTAPAYGDSESVLGATELAKQFDIVSKIPALNENDINIEHYINSSLQQLGIEKLAAVLFHQVEDIISSPYAQTRFNSLMQQKEQGRVNKVGVSVYTPEQLEYCIKHFQIDIVQLPLNCLDQRFIQTNWLSKLADKGIEIHCRSVFLQGVLLIPPAQRPKYFANFNKIIGQFDRICHLQQISPLILALAVAINRQEISKVIVGCCSSQQLQEIITAAREANKVNIDLSTLSSNNEQLILPQNWQVS